MFRQVISIRWIEDVTDQQKQAYRDALDGLRTIPELLDLRWGDDAGIFEGNYDFVAVMDYDDFASARRYVEHPLHQAYVREPRPGGDSRPGGGPARVAAGSPAAVWAPGPGPSVG